MVLDLARSLHRRGHRVTVMSLAHGGALCPSFGAIPIVSVARRTGFDEALPLRIARVLRELGVDVVHTHNPAALTYCVPGARWAGARRVIHTKHGANPPRSLADLAMRRALIRTCDAYVAVSEPTAEVARKLDRAPAKLLRVIPNGIDTDFYAHDADKRFEIRKQLGISEGALVLGTVGRLVPEKNQLLLVEAAKPLLGQGVHLVIAGEGPERRAIESAISDSMRAFVHLTGARDDIPALLSAFDVFVLSSSTEGLPLAVPEAMAASLPVVATNVGGLPTVVRDQKTGLLVPPRDKNALFIAMQSLLSDEARRREFGKEAVIEARHKFGLDRVVGAYEALYFDDVGAQEIRLGSRLDRRGASRGSSLQSGFIA